MAALAIVPQQPQQADLPVVASLLSEPVFTLSQLAGELQLSHERTRKLFEREPGVIVIPGPGKGTGMSAGRKRKKSKDSYRVPRSVALRVITRMRNPIAA